MLSNHSNQINTLFTKLDDNSEFEIMFNNYKPNNKLSIIKFMNVLNYIKWRSKEDKLELIKTTSLDISYSVDIGKTYRISVNGIDRINNILNLIHQRQNNIAFSLLINQFYNTDNIEFIIKSIDRKTIIDIDQYDIRIRLSSEKPMAKQDLDFLSNLQHMDTDKILFRYKQRVSLLLGNNIKLDLTFIKSSSNPNTLVHSSTNYEVECDYSSSKSKIDSKILDKILEEVVKVKKVLENTDDVLSKDESDNIITQYKKVAFGFETNTTSQLYSMKPITAEVQHIVDKIPNKYSVTDKADGEHYNVFVYNGNIYLITNNLVVTKTHYTVKNLDTSIIEGELIHLTKDKKYLFMMFDCLFYNGKDCRNESNLDVRLAFIDDFINKMNIKSYNIKPFNEKFNIMKQEEHYEKEMINFYTNINKLLDENKQNDILFHKKMFLFPTGGDNSEVYSFAHLIWTGCTSNQKVNCRYMLDGIIFTGVNQKYTQDRREHKLPIYKYKPPTTNSIDVYISFHRNIETNKFVDIYDNSINNSTNTPFRIINFFVGDSIGSNEMPVPFMKEENNHEAFFPLVRDEVRDVEGNIVNDNTVVEVIYVNDNLIPHQYRWKILRTRWDKTEMVLRYKKSYGNYKEVAIKVWKSMRESVTIEEIAKLARPSNYVAQQQQLAQRIDTKIISSERAQDKYYQKVTKLGEIFKGFHNYIKSNLIYTYCAEAKLHMNDKPSRKTVLDIGTGRGGDIMKLWHARVYECVGLEPSYQDLFGSIDSATVRYNENKTKFPGFTKFTFVQADARLPLISNIQEKSLTDMSFSNKSTMDSIFMKTKKQFDVINIQFAIHYFYDTEDSAQNFINTVKTHLKKDGFLLCTLFDANIVMKLLGDKNTYTSYYTNDEGQRGKFFELVKKFDGEIKDTSGQLIDVHMDWITDGYFTESLLTPKYLIKTMKDAGCVLVDTDLFANQHTLTKDWITNVTKSEPNPKNRKFYEDIRKFFGDLKDVDREGKVWNDLFRFYVFKKL
jgi:hypothetical protein